MRTLICMYAHQVCAPRKSDQAYLTYLTYLYLTSGSIAINSYGTLLLLPDLLHVVYRHFRNLSL